jgi:hypothetical protein
MKMWNSQKFVFFFSAVAAISLLYLFLAWQKVQLYDNFLRNGIQTTAKVVEHYVTTGSRGYGRNHHFVYRFTDSREGSHKNQFNRKEADKRFEVGQKIEIIYDPLDPAKSIPFMMLPDDLYQPIYSSLKFMAAALMVTFAFGTFVFSKFALTRFRWASLKRFLGRNDR